MIPQSFIQELLNRIDLVELVNKVVPLKKTGKNFQACCPFHNEKTPSFNVNPQKQFFKCFGCGASGTAIGFVMQYEGLNFPEAVKRLADQVGMQVPAEDPKTAEREARARTLTDRMQLAADFYKESLKTSQRAQDTSKVAASAERRRAVTVWGTHRTTFTVCATCSAVSTTTRKWKKRTVAVSSSSMTKVTDTIGTAAA